MAIPDVNTRNNSELQTVVFDSPDGSRKIDGKIVGLHRLPRLSRRDPDLVLVAIDQPQLNPDIYERVVGLNYAAMQKVKPDYFDATALLGPEEFEFGGFKFRRNQPVLFKHSGNHYIGRAFAVTTTQTPEPLLLVDTGISESYEVCALTRDEYLFWNKPQSFEDFINYQIENNPEGIVTNDPSKLISLEEVVEVWDLNINHPRVKSYLLDSRNPFFSRYYATCPSLAEALTRMYNNHWENK